MGEELPKTIFAHGWWLVVGDQDEQIVGNVVNPLDWVDQYGADAVRYYLDAGLVLGDDANFMREFLQTLQQRFGMIMGICSTE